MKSENKNLLTTNMFRRPEEPKKEQYRTSEIKIVFGERNFTYDHEQFQKDHDHWKFITGPKPEPEWILNKDQEPEYGQLIYMASSKYSYSISYEYGKSPLPSQGIKWADKSTYDKTLKEWQDNQIIFEGWRHEKSSYDNFIKGDLILTFVDNGIILYGKGDKMIYNGPCDVDLFEKLLEIKER